MKDSSERAGELRAPMLKVLVPLAAGIRCAGAVHAEAAAAAGLFAAVFCAALLLRRSVAGGVLTYAAVAMYGFALMTLRRAEPLLPGGGEAVVEAAVVESAGGRCEVMLRRVLHGGEWCRAEGRMNLAMADEGLSAGDLIRAHVVLRPFPAGGYGRQLLARGVVAAGRVERMRLTGERVWTPRIGAARLRHIAAGRLGRLGLSPASRAVALAMSLGDRNGLGAVERERYAASGAAHVLALSGLHAGIVFLLINMLLLWLPLLRYGHIIRAVTAVAALWCYAAVTGLSPSVVRAACMFSGVQAAAAVSRRHAAFNMLCGAAAVMLGVDPAALGDVGFVMSFVAVAALIVWFPPVFRRVRCGRRLTDWIWSLFLAGGICTVALAPLTAAVFGRVAVAGIFINPAVVLTASVIVFVSLLWIVAPVPLLAPAVSWVVEGAAGLQEGIVSAAASLPWGSVDLRAAPWVAWAVYVCLVAAAAWPRRKIRSKGLTLHHDDTR